MTWRDWSATVARALLVVALAAVIPGLSVRHQDQIACKSGDSAIFFLEAQAVPSATLVPCFYPLPVGWSYGESEARSGLVRAWLDSDRAGDRAVELVLTRTCDVSKSIRVHLAHAPPGLVRYDEPASVHLDSWASYYRFPGGCVTYRFSFTRQTAPAIFEQADRFLGFNPRALYVASLQEQEGLSLCGTGVPPCPG
jgi:hypothetical protein